MRGEEHEDGAGAVALVVIILAQRLARFHRQRRDVVIEQLLARLVHADQRLIRIRLFRVNVEHLLHLRDEAGGVAFGDAVTFDAPGLQLVFFSVLRTVSLQMVATTFRFTNSSARSDSVQRACPAGAGEQQIATSVASALPSSFAGVGGVGGVSRTLRSTAAVSP